MGADGYFEHSSARRHPFSGSASIAGTGRHATATLSVGENLLLVVTGRRPAVAMQLWIELRRSIARTSSPHAGGRSGLRAPPGLAARYKGSSHDHHHIDFGIVAKRTITVPAGVPLRHAALVSGRAAPLSVDRGSRSSRRHSLLLLAALQVSQPHVWVIRSSNESERNGWQTDEGQGRDVAADGSKPRQLIEPRKRWRGRQHDQLSR